MALNKLYSTLPDMRGNPGANQFGTLRVNIPSVGRIHNIKAQVTKGGVLATLADMKKSIGEVRFILNSEVVRRCTLAEYMAMIEVNGFVNEDGLISYFFSEAWRALVTDEEVLAIDVRRYAQVAMEFDITNDATPLEFNFEYEYDERAKVDGAGQQIAGIISFTRQSENLGGGEPIVILNPLNGPLQRLHFIVPSTVDITRIRVLQGDTAIFDRWNTAARPSLRQQLKDMGMSLAQDYTDANGTHKVVSILFDNNQQLRNALTDTNGLKIQLSLSTGCPVIILRETQFAR